MKFRLQSNRATGCTTIDHVYSSTTRGEFCYCGQRRWGVEPEKKARAFRDADGHVLRAVRKVLMSQSTMSGHVYVCLMQGCGHVVVKQTETKSSWMNIKVRCRMCERIYQELEEEEAKARTQAENKRRKEMKLIQALLARKRLFIRLPKHRRGKRGHENGSAILLKRRKRPSVTAPKVASGRGVISIRSNRRSSGRNTDD